MDTITISLNPEDCSYISPETMELINRHNQTVENCVRDVAIDTIIDILISANIIPGRDFYETILENSLSNNSDYNTLSERYKLINEIIDLDKKINYQKKIKKDNITSIIFDENDYRNKFTDELTAYKNILTRRYDELKDIEKENIKVENVTTIIVP